MYAKIENGVVVEYPLYEGDLERRFPEYVFPLDSHLEENNGVLCPEGYVRVTQTFIQNPDPKKRYTKKTIPELDKIDGEWKLGWVIEDLSPEEIEKCKIACSNGARRERNKRLLESDHFMLNDVLEKFTETEKNLWKSYRQELRDITIQEEFPFYIIWPTPPK